MLVLVSIQLILLLAASVFLLLDVRAGMEDDSRSKARAFRAGLYLMASIAGATLLISVADGEWMLVLALVPITFLSLLRFSMIARDWWTGWRLPVYTCALIALGIMLTLPLMPYPFSRTYVMQELNLIDTDLGRPDTIDPEAVRTVRA